MIKCLKGKSCGGTCIEKKKKCKATLEPKISEVLDKAMTKARGARDRFLAMYPDAKAAPKSQIAQLQSALEMGDLTKEDVGRDVSVLVAEAQESLQRYKDLREHFVQTKGKSHPAVKQYDDKIQKLEEALKGPRGEDYIGVKARIRSENYDKKLNILPLKRIGDPNYRNWQDSISSSSKRIGEGQSGVVMLSSSGEAVKRGDVNLQEPIIMRKVGLADLGPQLIAADLDGPGRDLRPGYDVHFGRIAMSMVSGREMGDKPPGVKIGGQPVGEVYWKTRAAIHRLGVAHNDMHPFNLLIDDKGKGRLVDFGLSQDNPKAALAEAIGIFREGFALPSPGGMGRGDWQVTRWEGTGASDLINAYRGSAFYNDKLHREIPSASRVLRNYGNVKEKLKEWGFSQDSIRMMEEHGIRSPLESYEQGQWAKLTDGQAHELIDTLYKGV